MGVCPVCFIMSQIIFLLVPLFMQLDKEVFAISRQRMRQLQSWENRKAQREMGIQQKIKTQL